MERIMAVVSCEKLFCERFCAFVNNNSHIVFTAVPFTELRSFEAYRKDHEIPVVLCDRDFYDAADLPGSGTKTIPLCDNESEAGEKNAIYRYQSAEAITREIMENLGDLRFARGLSFTGRPVSVLGVYSPGECPQKTSFALCLAAELRKRHKVLYINFEEFSGISSITGERYDRGLSNMIYYLKQGTLSGQRIMSMIYSIAGFDYIPPIRFADDYSAVTGEECQRLIQTIFAETLYDIILADLPGSLRVSSDIMDLCERIYVPIEERQECCGRIKDFDDYLNQSGRDKLAAKIRKLKLPEKEAGEKRTFYGAEYIDSLLFGAMGDLCLREVCDDEC